MTLDIQLEANIKTKLKSMAYVYKSDPKLQLGHIIV